MTAISKPTRPRMIILCVLAFVIAAGSLAAFAVPPVQVLRVTTNQTLTGKCCFMWGDTVRVTEPSTVQPVVVTLSTDYVASDPFYSGLSLNGGPCRFYGSGSIERYSALDGTLTTALFQWVIYPADGLVKGVNTFTLCGGGAFNDDDTITLGFRTLAARIGK